MSSNPEERRGAPRVAQAFIIRYRRSDISGSSWLVSPARDLSSQGARFISEHTFQSGERLDVQLTLPSSQEPVLVKARVKWIKPIQLGMVELGVAFEAEDATTREVLERAITYVLQKRQQS